MGGVPGWVLGVRQETDLDPDPVPDAQGPGWAHPGPLGPYGDTLGALLGTYVFVGKNKNQRPH